MPGVESDQPLGRLTEQLSVRVPGRRLTVQAERESERLWLVEVGPKEPWLTELDGDAMVWRTSPEKWEREWVVAGQLRPPLPPDMRDVRVTLTPSGRVYRAATTQTCFVVVLPPDADREDVTLSWHDSTGHVHEEDLLNPPGSRSLVEWLGSDPEGNGWVAYAPLDD